MNSWRSLAIKNASSPSKALHLYIQMQRLSIPFDSFSILFALKSSTQLNCSTLIRQLHTHLLKLGFNFHVYVSTALLKAYVATSLIDACYMFDEMPVRNTVTWNTMITGYSRSGDIEKARIIFDKMPVRNLASWNAMISGYIHGGLWDKGLMLFRKMLLDEKLMPDQLTLGSILMGCGHMGSIGLLSGKSINAFAMKNGWELNVDLGTVLVNMYAKCGYLKNAYSVFNMMQDKNIVTWTALICGAAQHGRGKEASAIIEKMMETGLQPNELTFTGILSACAQAGLVEEGRTYFRMIPEYRLRPRIQHYGCLIDLLGKAGELEEAYEVIKTMPFEPNVLIWTSFLSSCKVHKKFEMVDGVIDRILGTVGLENDGGVYSLICDFYALSDKWNDAERVRMLMSKQKVKKARGSSFIRSGV